MKSRFIKIERMDYSKDWFYYKDSNLEHVNIQFQELKYLDRVKSYSKISLYVGLSFISLVIIYLFISLGFTKFSLLFSLAIISVSLAVHMSNILISRYQNKYFLISLYADSSHIKLSYLLYYTKVEFKSDWKYVNIYSSETMGRSPKIVMTINQNRNKIMKIYSDINEGLIFKDMSLLIDNLNKLKNASR
jgi:hypothetical protein